MPQDNNSGPPDKHERKAEPIKAGPEEKGVGTKSAETRIWAAANKLTCDGEELFQEKQK